MRAALARLDFDVAGLSPGRGPALRAMLSLQMTKDLLAPLDATRTEHALGRLRAALATHQSSGGVFFDSGAWLITAHRL